MSSSEQKDKPEYCYSSGCPLSSISRGFVLGSGDPKTAKIALMLEAPGKDETMLQIQVHKERDFLSTPAKVNAELARRKRAYPDIDPKILSRGAPVVGATGNILEQWILRAVGLQREELFIDNTLRCLPPPNKQGKNYPVGEERHKAEACCRHYDRLEEFKPTAITMSLHPAALLREITPLPLVVKDMEKARSFSQQGHRVLMLLGGMSAKAFARYGDNIGKWRGSYNLVPSGWYKTLITRYFSSEYKKTKKKLSKVSQIKKSITDMNPIEYTEHLFDVTPKKIRKKRKKKEMA
jgi:hypothetical protein